MGTHLYGCKDGIWHGVLYRRWETYRDGINRHFQLVLPAKSVNDVLEGLLVGAGTWERGNPGEVLARLYWPSQRKEVEQWCYGYLQEISISQG